MSYTPPSGTTVALTFKPPTPFTAPPASNVIIDFASTQPFLFFLAPTPGS